MSINLYDISAESYKQVLGAVSNVLDKSKTFCEENGIDPNSLLEKRFADDMLPLTFQLNSVRHHSVGSVEGLFAGEFNPPPSLPDMNFNDFQGFIADANSSLSEYETAAINDLIGKTVLFKFGDTEIPFTAENFVLSFSLPNLYFHAATTYDLMRSAGVPLGKRDFLGQLRIGT
ncbi:MAG: DUF1993 domain-containing protein [Pseudomonadota bacterium]